MSSSDQLFLFLVFVVVLVRSYRRLAKIERELERQAYDLPPESRRRSLI